MLMTLAFFLLLIISWPLALIAAVLYAAFCGVGLALKVAGAIAGVVFALLAVALLVMVMAVAIPLAVIF